MTEENYETFHITRYSFTEAERKILLDNDEERVELAKKALAEDKSRNKFTDTRQRVILYLIFMEWAAVSVGVGFYIWRWWP
jgi:hypothetical protein